jgi:ferredoxin-NADP reductase
MPAFDRPLRAITRSRLAAAATWPHGPEAFAQLVDPTWSTSRVLARVTGIRHQTGDTTTLTLTPNAAWTGHDAGQHVLLTVGVRGIQLSRCFSVASSAHDRGTLELTCKAGHGSVVARHLRTVALGTVVELSQAQGTFTLPVPRPAAIALIGAGSGLTPLLSMLRTLDDEGHDGEVSFVQYARGGDDVLYGPELVAIAGRHPGWRVTTVTERDPSGDLTGRFEPDHLDHAGIDPDRHWLAVCGPAPFMAAVQDAWLASGGAPERFRTESFGAPVPAAGGGAAAGTVRFLASGVEVTSDGRPLLLQAEAAGLRPAHGCRRGICRTCVVTKSSGAVVDAVTGTVDRDPGTTIRICVSVPDGDVDLEL